MLYPAVILLVITTFAMWAEIIIYLFGCWLAPRLLRGLLSCFLGLLSPPCHSRILLVKGVRKGSLLPIIGLGAHFQFLNQFMHVETVNFAFHG